MYATIAREQKGDLSQCQYRVGGTHTKMEDQRLIQRCLAGDGEAWNTLLARYQERIYRFAYKLAHNHEDAEDITVHVCMRLYEHIRSIRSGSELVPWLYRVAHNAYIDKCVRPRLRMNCLSFDSLLNEDGVSIWEVPDPSPQPEERALEEERSVTLGNAVLNLPKAQRTLMTLYYQKGYSYREMAQVTGLPVGTVKSRLARARGELRERLTAL